MSDSKRIDPIQGEIIHEYDGIQEADNHLPLWWLWTLFGAMIFAAGYWFYYEEFEVAPGLQQAYFAEKAEEQQRLGGDPTDAQLLALVGTPATDQGKATFASTCSPCHEAQGQGKIGPNLTDNAWVHGGAPLDIYRVVRDGVPAKGMPAWGASLGPLGVQQVVAFILSIRDTNVPGKQPEGSPYLAGATQAEPKPALADSN